MSGILWTWMRGTKCAETMSVALRCPQLAWRLSLSLSMSPLNAVTHMMFSCFDCLFHV
jgi:hypothetical protein